MITDEPPRRKALRTEFRESDKLGTLRLPKDERLRSRADAIEIAMESGNRKLARQACAEFLAAAAKFYQVETPQVRVLEARPLRVRDGGAASELFGDYHPKTKVIRVWMRTAVHKRVTSFGTFISTLCHELCHHLDYERFGFRDSPHTRGFYERTAVLYHHVRGTPEKQLFWIPMSGNRWRIDWRRLNRS